MFAGKGFEDQRHVYIVFVIGTVQYMYAEGFDNF